MALTKCHVCKDGFIGVDGYCTICRAFLVLGPPAADDFRPMSYNQAATIIELLRGLQKAVESVTSTECETGSSTPKPTIKVSVVGEVDVVGDVTAHAPR